MQIAFCLEMLYTELPFVQRLATAKSDGIEWFEFWDWRNKDLNVLLHEMNLLNMKVSNLSGNRQFGMIDPGERALFLEELHETGAIAKRIGCPTLMLLVQRLEEDGRAVSPLTFLSRNEKIEQIIACGFEAGELAEKLDLHIVIEPLNDVLDHPGYFLNSSRLAFHIIGEINHPRVKLLYDVYHMAMMGEDVYHDIENNLDLIGYFHFADKPGRNEPGTGEIDYKNIFLLLNRLKYDGFIGGEFYPSTGDSHNAVRETLKLFAHLT